MKKSMAIVCALLLAHGVSHAQEKKFSFNLGFGAGAPLSAETFTEAYSVGSLGSLGLDYRQSQSFSFGAEMGYASFALDRKGFLKLNGQEDDPGIKLKGGDMNVVELLGLGKYIFNAAQTNDNFYGLVGIGLAAGKASKLTVTTAEGKFEYEDDGGSDMMMVFGLGFKHTFGTKWKTYAEVRYAKVFADESVSYLPVRVGFIF